MKNPAKKGGADLVGTDQHCLTKNRDSRPLELAGLRALHLIALGVRPELASMLAGLAFGGGR